MSASEKKPLRTNKKYIYTYIIYFLERKKMFVYIFIFILFFADKCVGVCFLRII